MMDWQWRTNQSPSGRVTLTSRVISNNISKLSKRPNWSRVFINIESWNWISAKEYRQQATFGVSSVIGRSNARRFGHFTQQQRWLSLVTSSRAPRSSKLSTTRYQDVPLDQSGRSTVFQGIEWHSNLESRYRVTFESRVQVSNYVRISSPGIKLRSNLESRYRITFESRVQVSSYVWIFTAWIRVGGVETVRHEARRDVNNRATESRKLKATRHLSRERDSATYGRVARRHDFPSARNRPG